MIFLIVLNKLIKIFTLSVFTSNAFGQSTYIVKANDTLSKIVAKQTSSSSSLYGKHGRISKIILLNPHIKNPDEIYVGDRIFLEEKEKSEIVLTLQKKVHPEHNNTQEKKVKQKSDIKNYQLQDSWKIAANYGFKYFDYKQSGTLGSANVALTIVGVITAYSRYQVSDYAIEFAYQSYDLEYATSTEAGNEDLTSFNLFGEYKGIIAGASFNETPLFKNDSGTVLLSKMSLLNLNLGYRKEWLFPVKKRTTVSTSAIFSYPLSASSNNLDIETTKVTGLEAALKFELSRNILTRTDYQIFLNWPIALTYQSLSTTLSWAGTSGTSKSTILSIGSHLGIDVRF